MKKVITFLLPILLLVGIAYLVKESKNRDNILGSFSENSLDTLQTTHFLTTNESGFNIAWFEANPEKVKLIPNFEKPLTAKEAKIEYGCNNLINGGFYTKEGGPLGLFVNDQGKLESWHTSGLLNGLFSINYLETPRITRTEPKDIVRIGIQSGPMIKENGSFLKVSSSDEKARRSIVFTTGENRLYFAIVYDAVSQFTGPTLYELPVVLGEFENQSGIVIADALNLDGGSTSSFYTESKSLPEISFSGSFFCEQ